MFARMGKENVMEPKKAREIIDGTQTPVVPTQEYKEAWDTVLWQDTPERKAANRAAQSAMYSWLVSGGYSKGAETHERNLIELGAHWGWANGNHIPSALESEAMIEIMALHERK